MNSLKNSLISFLLMKFHFHQCLDKSKEWLELLIFLSIIKSEFKMVNGIYGKRKFQLSISILKKSPMLMLLFQQLIPWDIKKFSVLGFQNTDHSYCVVHQVLVKLWLSCQLLKLFHNLKWSSSISPQEQAQVLSWNNSSIIVST